MMHMIRKILLTGVFVLLAASAFGEYYQYTDENGNTRFTDDLYQVPETQRATIKTFETETNVPDETATEAPSESEEMEADGLSGTEEIDAAETVETTEQPENVETTPSNIPNDKGEGASQTTAVELNKMQSALNETRAALETERAALEAQTPKDRAPSNKRIAHSAKVDALNAKILKYGEDLKAFEEKAAAFNNQEKKSGRIEKQRKKDSDSF